VREALRQHYHNQGFCDALSVGRPNPGRMDNAARDAYDRGFAEGKRAEQRIIRKACEAIVKAEQERLARA
jgi:hypothetical protein